MSAIVLCGDAVTTTALVLALSWPGRAASSGGVVAQRPESGTVGDRVDSPVIDRLIIESDPSGGSLIGWLGLDPHRTLTTAVTSPSDDGESTRYRDRWWQRHAQSIGGGLAVLASPIRSVEASTSQARAHRSLLGDIGSLGDPVVFIDCGRGTPTGPRIPAGVTLVVLVHRQLGGSAAAAGPRVEQLRERFESLETHGHRPAVVIIGAHPFDPSQIVAYLSDGAGLTAVTLPEDRLTAEVLAGRVGCSSRRLQRRALMRAGRVASLRLRAELLALGDGDSAVSSQGRGR